MKIKPVWKWHDMWIGAYWSPRNRKLWILFFGLGFLLDFKKPKIA